MEKDKKMILTLPANLHKKLKMASAKTSYAMNLIVNIAIKNYLENK